MTTGMRPGLSGLLPHLYLQHGEESPQRLSTGKIHKYSVYSLACIIMSYEVAFFSYFYDIRSAKGAFLLPFSVNVV